MIFTTDDEAPTTRRIPRTGAPASSRARHRYRVAITYREPGYALQSGHDRPYGGQFDVQASDEDDAIARARAQFDHLAQQSSVSWVRVIEHIECRLLSEP